MCYHCAVFLPSMLSMVPIADSQLLGRIVVVSLYDPAVTSTKLSSYIDAFSRRIQKPKNRILFEPVC